MSELITRGPASIERSPELIAAEINSIKSQTRKMVLYNSIEIGRRLVEAKSLIEHGQWGAWLEESVKYSKSTANNLMRIFDEYGSDQITLLEDNAKSQALGSLSYTQAVALLGVPEEEREQFVKEHDIDNMSTRELQEAIKERDLAKQTAIEKAEEAKKLMDEKLQLESNLRVKDEVLRETQTDVKMLQNALQKERDENKKEVSKLEQAIYDYKTKLDAAQKAGDSEGVAQLQESLEEAEINLEKSAIRISELERQLKEAPLELAATVEKIPEEVEKELTELRNNSITIKYKVYFNALVENFDNLLKAMKEMEDVSADTYGKFKNATGGLIEKMRERL